MARIEDGVVRLTALLEGLNWKRVHEAHEVPASDRQGRV